MPWIKCEVGLSVLSGEKYRGSTRSGRSQTQDGEGIKNFLSARGSKALGLGGGPGLT